MGKRNLIRKYKNLHYVYLHIDPRTSQVVYVGKGTGDRAWHIHNRSPKHKEWVNILKSLNLEPTIKLLHVFEDAEKAFIREKMVISFLRKLRIKLFNRSPGGQWVPSGKGHPLTGRIKSLETRKRISDTRKRRKIPSWNKGRKTGPNLNMSEVMKIKMKGNKHKLGKKHTDSFKAAVSKRLIGNQFRSRKILCVNNGKIYNSVKEAWTELKLDDRSIFRVLKGEWKHTKGYRFQYID
jgi:hypothetical protein